MTDDDQQRKQPADKAYEIGYGRPLKVTRFKPGQSGNPKGRKHKPKSAQAQMRTVLSKKVNITEGGRTKRLTLQEVMLRSIANKAAKGDHRAANFVLGLINSEAASQSETIDETKLSADDQELFEQMMTELTSPNGLSDQVGGIDPEPETQDSVPAEQEEPTDET